MGMETHALVHTGHLQYIHTLLFMEDLHIKRFAAGSSRVADDMSQD